MPLSLQPLRIAQRQHQTAGCIHRHPQSGRHLSASVSCRLPVSLCLAASSRPNLALSIFSAGSHKTHCLQSYSAQPLSSRLERLRVHASSLQLSRSELPAASSGKLESTQLNDSVRQRVQDAVESLKFEVTVGDVAAKAGVTVAEAEQALTALAADTYGTLKVTDQGDIAYAFRSDFKSVLVSRSLSLRLQPTLKAASQVLKDFDEQALALGSRIAFGAALISSVAIVYLSIMVLLSASEDRDNRSRRSSGFGTYMFIDTLDLLWYPRTRYSRTQRSRQGGGEMGFLEAVFSFVLGDGNPNVAYEEQRWQMVGNYIKAKGGVVTAEELAPYLDHQTTYDLSDPSNNDESYVVPALIRFGGNAEVDEQGNLLYHFPSLQISGSSPTPRALPAQPALESEWTLSKAGQGQKTAAAILGAVNLVGVIILQSILNSPKIAMAVYTGKEIGAYAVMISRLMPFLQIYAASFFIVPVVRWFLNQARNRQIIARNEARTAAQQLLRAPPRRLAAKLNSAKQAAKHRVISDRDVVYRSDRNQADQDRDYDAEEFDRRLSESGSRSRGRVGDGGSALREVRDLYRDSQYRESQNG